MAKLGSKARPLILRVQSQERAYFVAAACAKHGWDYIMGIEPDQPEDLGDLDMMVSPALPARSAKIERNGPCPCGSGKKYKKCCGSAAAAIPSAEPKLSAVIWEYAEPLTKPVTGAAATKKAAQMAILCWNAALFPQDEQQAFIADALQNLAAGDSTLEQNLLAILEMMIARKLEYFGDDDRVIVNYSLTDTEDGVHLLVSSVRRKPDARVPQQAISA